MNGIKIDEKIQAVLLSELKSARNSLDPKTFSEIERIILASIRNHYINQNDVKSILLYLDNSTKRKTSDTVLVPNSSKNSGQFQDQEDNLCVHHKVVLAQIRDYDYMRFRRTLLYLLRSHESYKRIERWK